MQPLDATVELRGMKRVGEPEETLAEVLDRGNSAVGFSRSQGINSAETRVALPPIVFTRELRSQPKKWDVPGADCRRLCGVHHVL